MRGKTLLDMYKMAPDEPKEEQLYGTDANSMRKQDTVIAEFTFVAARKESQLDGLTIVQLEIYHCNSIVAHLSSAI